MKKQDLAKLALLGICTGALLAKPSLFSQPTKSKVTDAKIKENNATNMNYRLMTEEELLLELSPEGEALYKSLDAEGKKLALYTASQKCNGTNLCRGLNACQTEDNDCAGKGACKGTSKCSIGDKNLAVKLVANKMKAKRNALK